MSTIYGSAPEQPLDVEIGRFNRLRVVRERDIGLFLDGGRMGSILLPRRYVEDGPQVGDELEVFVYLDSEDDLIATTEQPLLQVGQIALLEVRSVTAVGAFLDWGLPKDLLLPFGQQKRKVEAGQKVLVRAYLDNSNRICASTKLDRFLDQEPCEYKKHRKVELIITDRTDLGVKAIVDQRYWGLIHHSELFRSLRFGQRVVGYIQQVRPDGKIDLMLNQPGYGGIDGLAQQILDQLRHNGGFLPLTDRSSPQQISARFGVSKKRFKMALGSLYKQRLVELTPDGVRML